ncbi:hypothetical protein GE061_001673 [Apolygus lucorum]|uniref:Uncharacterized protein n=1 Tax=Apolygus lucorum TaxID=248454 RepID=A0A8S9YA22_APOLU|nr:hypothetical protein GE061_001673 [Apolygus lucorum]
MHIRSILAPSTDPLDNLAVMADKVFELSPPQHQVQALGTQDITGDRLSRLETHIAQLTASVAALQTSRQPRGRSDSHNFRARLATPSADKTTVCRFHRRYGVNARRCLLPCTFQVTGSAAPAEN